MRQGHKREKGPAPQRVGVNPHITVAPTDRPDYDPVAELTGSPWFSNIEQHDFPFTVSYSACEFLTLISTNASHRRLDEGTRQRLHTGFTNAIDTELAGTVTKPYNCLLVLATATPEDS